MRSRRHWHRICRGRRRGRGRVSFPRCRSRDRRSGRLLRSWRAACQTVFHIRCRCIRKSASFCSLSLVRMHRPGPVDFNFHAGKTYVLRYAAQASLCINFPRKQGLRTPPGISVFGFRVPALHCIRIEITYNRRVREVFAGFVLDVTLAVAA